MTCGLASLLLALLIKTESGNHTSHLSVLSSHLKSFFLVFGVNALALYVSSELLAILLKNIEVSEMVYNGIHAVIAPLKWASFAYAVYFVLLNFAIGYVLYRKKIYIKL
jgi:predicted acyltransferase